MSKYGDIELGLGAAVVVHLIQFFPAPNDDYSKYHLVIDNFFASPELLRHLREKSIAATKTVRTCVMENSPLKAVDQVAKMERGSSDAAVHTFLNILAIRCEDNKVVCIFSTNVGKNEQKRQNATVKKRGKASAYFCVES